mmetsp:Transcript_23912/g.55494  ORF Transcript_23912/g.55494 Transcript_23912/m.55494 type:complete len:208 (-) Transcript_23912:89-712(-)
MWSSNTPRRCSAVATSGAPKVHSPPEVPPSRAFEVSAASPTRARERSCEYTIQRFWQHGAPTSLDDDTSKPPRVRCSRSSSCAKRRNAGRASSLTPRSGSTVTSQWSVSCKSLSSYVRMVAPRRLPSSKYGTSVSSSRTCSCGIKGAAGKAEGHVCKGTFTHKHGRLCKQVPPPRRDQGSRDHRLRCRTWRQGRAAHMVVRAMSTAD